MISSWGATGGLKPAMSLNLLSGAISSLVSFTRATPATVTDFEGLIKTVKSGEVRFDGMRRVENLLTYSQDFSNAAWTKGTLTVIANSTTAPDGTTTASTLTLGVTSTAQYIYTPSVTTIGTLTHSVYVKANGYNYVQLMWGFGTDYANFFLSGAGSVSQNSGGSPSITSIGNGWYRCTITSVSSATSNAFIIPIQLSTETRYPVQSGNGTSGIYIWGAQLENITGRTNQNPSEYVSTNVLSYPYQGAGVDGVQYFPYTNPNCVINGAITQIPTVSINSSNSKFTYSTTTSGDCFSTPSSAVNQITGDLSLLVQVALDDWTPATVQTLVAKDGVSGGTRSWAFNIQTSGALRLNYSLDGTNIISVTASASTGFTDGTVHYVGVQREASTGIVRFYTSEDNRTFTLLGTQQTGTSGSLYNASSTAVQFGNLSSLSFALDGKIYDSHVYSGLKFTGTSTMVMDFDPSNWTSGSTFTGLETGEVWTLNGNSKIYQGLWDSVGPKCMLIEEARTNVFLNSTAPATQSYTTSATPYTISFYGSGSITLSGSYVAVVTGSNALTRTTLTFTPTALPLVMTVAGTITKPQLEAGSFATSYIETAGSQVTRNADQASMTGTNFSSWYNQSQGSLYVEYDLIGLIKASQGMQIINVLNGSGAGIELYNNVLGTQTSVYIGATSTNIISPPIINTKYKVLIAYTQTNLNTSVNGATPITITGTLPSNIISLNIGSYSGANFMDGHIRTLRYYPVALPSATLQALTS